LSRNIKRLLVPMLLAFSVAASGCGVINSLRSKNSLNDGVREFNKGKYDLAQERFERALELSPDNTNAQLYYARAVNARFEQSFTEDLAMKSIQAYENIIKNNPTNYEAIDQALAFQANVYDKLSGINPDKTEEFKNKRRETLLRRADLPSATAKTKADVYYTIGESYWKESYNLGLPYVSKKQPIPPEAQEKMKPRIQKAHEYLQKTLSVQPDYANAYFYEKLVFIEDTKVEPNAARLKELLAKQTEMHNKYMELQKHQQKEAADQSSSQ
jgi:tetratricopeptide (TPR) repeat protein